MNKMNIDRRQFLVGAATVAGAVSLGAADISFSPADATSTHKKQKALSIAFWNGERLVAADRLQSGDSKLVGTNVKLKIHGMDVIEPSISSIDVHYPVAVSEEQQHVPYKAWTRKSYAPTLAQTNVPVTTKGIELTIGHNGGTTVVPLEVASGTGKLKLNTGTYVISSNIDSWSIYHYEPSESVGLPGRLVRRSLSGFMPVSDDYITIEVDRA